MFFFKCQIFMRKLVFGNKSIVVKTNYPDISFNKWTYLVNPYVYFFIISSKCFFSGRPLLWKMARGQKMTLFKKTSPCNFCRTLEGPAMKRLFSSCLSVRRMVCQSVGRLVGRSVGRSVSRSDSFIVSVGLSVGRSKAFIVFH